MVAIITGKGTGLERSSAWVLGSRGQLGSAELGRSGEDVYVNVGNGNLVITRQDEFLIGVGPDSGIGRVYNSQGNLSDDNGDNWKATPAKCIWSAGGVNVAGATVTRRDWDGGEVTFGYDVALGKYVSMRGKGAYDTIVYNGQWHWIDGETLTDEYYSAADNYAISTRTDTDGNKLTYTYTSGKLTRVTDQNGEYTDLTWSGANLTQLVTTKSGGATLTRVRYGYDGSSRLVTVTVDLSPDDNLIDDGKTYVTSYTYDGSSKRVASISQTDGSYVAFTYALVGADYKIASYTQTIAAGVTRTTSFDYSVANRTTITDPAGQKTVFFYDTVQNLLQISYPPENANSTPRTVQFAYNANGDVTQAVLGPGNVIAYEYDASGNLTKERDSAGNTIARTYSAKYELLTETRYLVPDPDGSGSGQPTTPLTTRYAYDSESHLRYVVSAEGFVTQYEYNTAGQQIAANDYAGNSYSLAGLAENVSIAESTLTTWVAGLDKTTARRTETAYDFRGNVTTVSSWSKLLSNGLFDTGSERSQTNYVYDQFGNLLSRQVTGAAAGEVFTYDGLGRTLTATDAVGGVTRTSFLDATGQTVLTHANGLSEISTYNKAGELIAFSKSRAGGNLVDLTGWPANAASIPAGQATVPGWINPTGYTDETQWALTNGPDGIPVVAMRAGQLDASQEGGGNLTNEVPIDASKAYEFTYYFKLSDLGKHNIYFGLSGISPAMVENLDGTDNTNPYFLAMGTTEQNATLTADRWYKVVGYVLPQGAPNPGISPSGLYDTVTGQRIAGISTFRWNPERAAETVHARFFDYYGEANQQYSTYFYQPEIRQVATASVGGNLIDVSGWPGNPASIPGGQATVPGWMNPSGYTDETQWAATTGPNGAQVVAMRAGQLDASQEGGGNYTHEIAIDGTKAYEFTYYFKLSDLNKHAIYFGLSEGVPAMVETLDGTDNSNPYFFTRWIADQSGTFTADRWYKVVAYVLPQGAANPGALGGVYDTATGQKVLNVTNFRWNPERTGTTVHSRFFDYYGEANQQYSTYFYQPEVRQVSTATVAGPDTATSLYRYDNLGRLRMTVDPTGRRNYMMYDPIGRKIADIDADGSIIEYRYDGNDNLTSTTRYANKLSSGQLASLVDVNGNPTGAAFSTLRPAAHADDQWTFQVYDAAQRLVQNIDGTGATSVFTYDGASRLTATKTFANRLSAETVASLKAEAVNPNFWANANDGTLWWQGNFTPTATGTQIDGGNAYKFTANATAQWTAVCTPGTDAAAGDAVSYTISVKAVGSVTSEVLGVYGYTTGWGDVPSPVTAAIVSGPGTLTTIYGGIWTLSGLSTTEATRVTITRKMEQSETVGLYMYLKSADSNQVVAGEAVIAAAPVFARLRQSAVVLPTADSSNDRVSRSFYDKDGRLIAAMDAAGGLSQLFYDQSGRKVREIGSARAVTSSTRATDTLDQLKTSAGTSASDRRTDYVYDSRGYLRYTIDSSGHPTGYTYDGAGRIIRTTDYAGWIAGAASYPLSYVEAQLASTGLNTNSSNRISRSVYDAAGQLMFAIDATGAVVAFGYDNGGRVIKQTRYATAYAAAGDPSLATMQSWASANTAADYDRIDRTVYDLSGRVVFTVDALGYVTEHQYDRAGRASRDIRYAAAYTVSDGVTRESLAGQVATAGVSAKVNIVYAYDADGRLSDVTQDLTDSVVTVTHTVYDALGQATDVTVAYGTADASTTHYAYDAAGRVLTETRGFGSAVAATTTNTYDAVGNLLTTRFGDWTTRMTYDAVGRVLTVTVPVDTSSANDLVTVNEYDAFGSLVRVQDAKGVSKFLYYNSLGQMTLEVDRERYATQTNYTVFGEVAQVIRRAARTTGTPTVTAAPTIVTGTGDATTTFAYDKLSRLICVADAEGFQEYYYFNMFGNRLHLFNKTGGHTEYVYDKLGRMNYEYVYQKAYRADGSVQQDGYYKTQLTYDSRGNITRKYEALGLTEQRQTDYVYDKANRLVTVVNPIVTAVGTDLVTLTNTYPQDIYVYNARGDLIRHIDPVGATTFTYYDALGRKTDEISPVGTLSHWTYDGNGNLQTARVYGDPVALPTGPAYALPSPANANNYRQTVYGYDAAHRLITTTVAGLTSGAFVGSSYSTTYSGDIVSQAYYDKNGNVWAAVDGAGNITWTWYDALDRKIAQIDAENYLTCWTLDANGNATVETRYATRITGSFSGSTAASALPALAGTSAADRITNFTYDRNGRRLTETRLGVVAWTVDVNGLLAAAPSTSATIAYTYNGLGQVLTKTEANGDLTQYQYDAHGRLEKTTGAAFVDFMGTYLRPVTNLRYNGLGNLVRTVATGDSTTNAADRVTTNAYDAGGRLAATTDANGVVRSYGYDAAGRLVKESWSRFKSDGTTSVTEAIGYRYDLAGRLVTQAAATQSGASFVFGDATRIQYNAYGEVSGRGLTAGPDTAAVYQEAFFYDAGGRLFKSTGGDGTIKFMFYDKAGRATLTLTSAGADFASTTFGDAFGSLTAAGGTTIANAVTTVAVYDKRGLETQSRAPGRVLTAGGSATTLVTTRDYNAFGEQVNEIDPRGWLAGANPDSFKTEYGYNTLGRMIEKKSPSVNWTSESHAVSSARPTETYYYDISGRLVGVDDANGHRTTRQLVAGTGHEGGEALVHSERRADDSIVTNWHNVFGDARVLVNELGAVEVRGYDNMGRVTEVDHRGGLLNDYYVYDSLGRQTRHWNNFLGSSNVERTDYDAQGRVVSQIAFGGDATTSTYGWYDTFGTTGLGQFGGWQKVTTFANGRTIYENTDYFGRLTWRNDMGYHISTYGFDKAGRTTSQAVGGETLTFSYFNTGLTASVSNGAGNGTTYGYDAAGNEISEWTQKGYVVVQNATATFDALNRMTTWTEAGNGTLTSGSPPASIAWEYDLVGNIRRSNASYRSLDGAGTANGAAFPQDNWFLYDSMDRVTFDRGIIYAYDLAGRRATTSRVKDASYTIVVNESTGQTITRHHAINNVETYVYAADGTMTEVRILEDTFEPETGYVVGTQKLKSSSSYDAMGRQTHQVDWLGDGTNSAYDRTVTYNASGQVATEITVTKQWNSNFTSLDYYTNTTTNYYGSGSGYDLGSLEHSVTTNKKGSTLQSTITTTNSYDWRDGPVQASINIVTDNVSGTDTNYTTTLSYSPAGHLSSSYIADGRPRTVTFVTNMSGEIVRRDESDNNSSGGDPHEIWYRYGGKQLGYTGNNGTLETDYLGSIDNRTHTPPANPAAFMFGSSAAMPYADFTQALTPVTSYSQGSDAGSYTVRAGDTLESIAANLWGDSSLWYLLASANGLSGPGAPGVGRTLALPANAMSNAHNATTFKPYDPARAIGDLSPTNPKPAKKGGCGMIGMIMMVVIAVAVSALTYGALTGPTTTFLGAVLAGAASGVAGSVASQAFGLATGMQSKFDWKGVALGAISGAVGGGLGSLKGAAGAFLNADKLVSNVAKGVLSSTLSQGIGVATGLQKKFDWMGVATAGIAAGALGIASRTLAAHGLGVAPGDVTSRTPHNAAFYANQALSGAAGAIASAGARTLIQGSDFGDNILAALPDVIGSTIGNMIADGVQGSGSRGTAEAAGGAAPAAASDVGIAAPGSSGEISVNNDALSRAIGDWLTISLLPPDERIQALLETGRISLATADELTAIARTAREGARDQYMQNTGGAPAPSGPSGPRLGADGLPFLETRTDVYAIDNNTLDRRVAGYYNSFTPGTHSVTGSQEFDAAVAHNRQLIIEWDGIANSAINQRLFAVTGAPIAIAGAAASAPLLVSGTLFGTATGLISLDYGQSAVRGYLNGSFESQSTAGGTIFSGLTNGEYGEGAYALATLGFGASGWARSRFPAAPRVGVPVLGPRASTAPYANPANRPAYGPGQVEEVWASGQRNGRVFDPNTGDLLNWDRSISRAGQWDMGHLPGQEFRLLHQRYMSREIDLPTFLREYRNPANYRPELPSANRSRRYEGR